MFSNSDSGISHHSPFASCSAVIRRSSLGSEIQSSIATAARRPQWEGNAIDPNSAFTRSTKASASGSIVWSGMVRHLEQLISSIDTVDLQHQDRTNIRYI